MDTQPQQTIEAEKAAAAEEQSIRAAYRAKFGSEPPEEMVEPLVGVDLPFEVRAQFIRDLEDFVQGFVESECNES